MKRLKTWFKGLTTAGKVVTVAAVSMLSLSAVNAATQPSSLTDAKKTNATANDASKTEPKVKKDVVETKDISTTETIPFTSSTVNDPGLAQGLTEVRTAGVNGMRTITHEVTYTNGLETSRKEVSNSITTQPVNEVAAKGTKAPQSASCPNGTYVNSQGNTVCRPYESDSAPAGATAECDDGTYSFSQSRRGTCSGHGGVARWL